EVLLGVAALLMAEHQDLPRVEARDAADDRRVVVEAAIAVQLREVLGEEPHVVEHVRAPRVPRELHLLLRRELREDLLLELARLLVELADLGREVDGRGRQPAELGDLLLELDDRPLELEDQAVRRGRLAHERWPPRYRLSESTS